MTARLQKKTSANSDRSCLAAAAKLDVERALRIEALDYAGRLVYQQSVR